MTDARAARPPRTVTAKEGVQPWAKETFLVLRETARRYGATITTQELAERVQARSGLATRAAPRTWLGPVLALVVRACHKAELPPLTALVVGVRDGRVGPAYDEVLKAAGLPLFDDDADREWHAAESRLACYRHYGEVPEDARPALVSRGHGPSLRPKAPTRETPQGRMCPRCFIQMPLVGGCPNCD